MRRAPAVLAIVLGLAAALSGCTVPGAPPAPAVSTSADRGLESALGDLPVEPSATRPTRLAAGLLPPTNRWFSGLVFGEHVQRVFPTPLMATPTNAGLTVTLPTVAATADSIGSGDPGGLSMRLGSTGFTVTHYDALTVTMTYRDVVGPVADVLLAEGWPYVAITARRAMTATAGAAPTRDGPGLWRADAAGTRFEVRAPDATVDGTSVLLPKGATAVLYAVPAGVDPSLLAAGARGVVTGGTATGSLSPATARTTLRYTTAGNAPTVLAIRPGTTPVGVACTGAAVLTVYGRSPMCTGSTVTATVRRITPADSLDLSTVTAAQSTAIGEQLSRDLADTPAEPTDTYAGGKWLYRVANLLQLATALGRREDAATARDLLDASLIRWTEPAGCRSRADRCFVIDPVLHGVVGRAASFGSDQFNDHHFHYGYFLYAAAVAVADHPALTARLAPVIDLLAADIANPSPTSSFPQRRAFDAWAAHSWASGFSPFADGNNQESSSEAVNAWNGLALWAKATGRAALEEEAEWLLSCEAASAKRDWLEPDLGAFPAFRHAFVALNWGGKRDSATWFSPDPAAKLAIQLIPMSPVAEYLGGEPRRIRADLAEARGARTGLFADYLLMYESLGSSADLSDRAAAIPQTGIDSADSRAYLEAWLATH